jgi:hypothetical protein
MPREIPATEYRNVNSVFEVVVDGKVHRVEGKALQRWIVNERREQNGPGFLFSKRPALE